MRRSSDREACRARLAPGRLLLSFGCALATLLGSTAAFCGEGSDLAADPEAEAAYYDDLEIVDMTPDASPGLSIRHVGASIASVLGGGRDYWHKEREVLVDTTPSGAWVDLFYVRDNFQLRFEQARAPLKVILPARIKTGKRDSLGIRAFREGYHEERASIPVASEQDRIVLDLEPLPNLLEVLSYRYFAGRSTLVFLTTESPSFRVQEAEDGFTLFMSDTGTSPEADASLTGLASPMLEGAAAKQLGEDLMISVKFTPGAREQGVKIRSRQGRDAPRELYELSLDVVPAQGSRSTVANARAALERVTRAEVTGCALTFERALREDLGVASLTRALTPRGAFTDPYLRAAMRRLAELSPNEGIVDFPGGVQYRPRIPLELEAALIQAAEAQGYLALLRSFVGELEDDAYRRETLRSLVAPELDAARFSHTMDLAEKREGVCLASR